MSHLPKHQYRKNPQKSENKILEETDYSFAQIYRASLNTGSEE